MKKSKRFLALSLAVAMLPTFSFAKQFSDVSPTGTYKWAYSAIDELSNKNIIAGFNDGTYKPEDLVSLPQTLSLLKGIINPSDAEVTKARDTYGKDLINLGMDSWAIDAAAVCLQNNVITMKLLESAKSIGQIGPKYTTYPARENIAVFYAKALGLTRNADTSNLKHKDISNLPIERKEYLSALVNAGIFTSTGSNGNFNGRIGIRRAEMAIITKASYDYKSKIEVETAKGTLVYAATINGLNRLFIKDGNNTMNFDYNSNTKFTINGTSADASKLKEGQEVEVKYQKSASKELNGTALEVKIKDVVTQYVGYVSDISTDQIKIRYTENSSSLDLKSSDSISTSKVNTFKLGANPDISILGVTSTLSSVKKEDMVEFSLDSQSNIIKMIVTPKEGIINGTLKEIGLADTSKLLREITVTLKDNRDYKFYVRLDSSLKNSTIDNLKVGNTINAYTNYRFIGEKGKIAVNNGVFGKILDAKFDNDNNLSLIKIKDYLTSKEFEYNVTKNTNIYGFYNNRNGFSPNSYALIDSKNNTASKISIYNNNSKEGIYKVSASLDTSSQNLNNAGKFQVIEANPIAGETYYIKNKNFSVSGLTTKDLSPFVIYKFIVVVDTYDISPIMMLDGNSN